MKDYNIFKDWIDKQFKKGIPENSVAANFNIYEGSDKTYHIQIITAVEFDENDSDWACDPAFSSGEDICVIPRTDTIDGWREGLEYIANLIIQYLDEGQNKDWLCSLTAVGVGFVDGDLVLLQNKGCINKNAVTEYLQ